MPKSRKRVRKPHIRQPAFADRNFSSLDSHTRKKGQLDSPYRKLPGINFSSWYSDFLPNALWTCILASLLEREEYLALVRQTVMRAHDIEDDERPRGLVHNCLASTSTAVFDHIFSAVLSNDRARHILRALRLVESLPDAHHWERVLDKPDVEKDWSILIHAVADNFNHQSQRATDVRWMKVIHEIVSGNVHFAESFAEIVEDIRLYPNRGEMTSVRPQIRAMEMMTRGFESGEMTSERIPHKPLMGESFWK